MENNITLKELRKFKNKNCNLVIKKKNFNELYKKIRVSKVSKDEIVCGYKTFKIKNIVDISLLE